MNRAFLLAGGAFASLAIACSPGGGAAFDDDSVGTPGSGGGGNMGFTTGSGGDLTVASSSGSGGSASPLAEVYGHSATTLYKLDPTTKQVTVIGPFQGCSQIIDIAIDKDNQLYAATYGNLYTVNKDTAACTLIGTGSYPNSLSFVPEGTLDASSEALVGYNGANYVRIDPTNGSLSNVGGTIGGGYSSSGDVVSVIGGSSYLTVKGNGCSDCLLEIDPNTGQLIKNWGSVGFSSVFGLAYWGGKAYGFAAAGQLFEIQFNQDDTVTSNLITVPGAPSDLSFWGAGSSTSAPVDAPD